MLQPLKVKPKNDIEVRSGFEHKYIFSRRGFILEKIMPNF